MSHNDYSLLVQVYEHWIYYELPCKLERTWESMQNMRKIVLSLSRENREKI